MDGAMALEPEICPARDLPNGFDVRESPITPDVSGGECRRALLGNFQALWSSGR